MQTTIELPEPLLEEVQRLAARAQRPLGDVVIDLVRAGLAGLPEPVGESDRPEQWMVDWLTLGDELMQDAPEGPTARELLDQDRNRLEPR